MKTEPIALPVQIQTKDGQTRIKDSNGIVVADCAPQHAKQIADALNKQNAREEYLMHVQ